MSLSESNFNEDTDTAGQDSQALDQLYKLRKSIDNIDASIVHMLAERFKATQAVGVLKAQYNMPASDTTREEEQIIRLRALAAEADLDPEFAEKFLNFIISEVIMHHRRLVEKNN